MRSLMIGACYTCASRIPPAAPQQECSMHHEGLKPCNYIHAMLSYDHAVMSTMLCCAAGRHGQHGCGGDPGRGAEGQEREGPEASHGHAGRAPLLRRHAAAGEALALCITLAQQALYIKPWSWLCTVPILLVRDLHPWTTIRPPRRTIWGNTPLVKRLSDQPSVRRMPLTPTRHSMLLPCGA